MKNIIDLMPRIEQNRAFDRIAAAWEQSGLPDNECETAMILWAMANMPEEAALQGWPEMAERFGWVMVLQ